MKQVFFKCNGNCVWFLRFHSFFLSIAVFPWIAFIMSIDSRFDFKKAKNVLFYHQIELKIHKRRKYLPLNFWSDKKFYCISACVLFFSLCSVTPEPSLLWRLASNPTTPIWQVFISALCNSIYSSQFKTQCCNFQKNWHCAYPLQWNWTVWKSTLFN